jgi:hypothetical protein
MSMKLFCTRKSIKQQISHFSYVTNSKLTYYKNYHMYVVYKFCSIIKITDITN